MHFFERWFGLAPDADSGILEIICIALALALVTVALARRARRLKRRVQPRTIAARASAGEAGPARLVS